MNNSLCSSARLAMLLAGALAASSATTAAAEAFIDLGVSSTRTEADIAALPGSKPTSTDGGAHVGVGLRRELAQGSIGARVELDDVGGDLLLAVRALDYRRHLSERFALTAFAGAARLDLATPAFGYYLGGGVQVKELWPRWTLGVDLRLGDKIARDNLLPSDPQSSVRPDNFYDLRGVSVYLSLRF